MIMMCQHKLIDCDECATLVQDVDSWEAVHVWGLYVGKSVFSAQFFHEPKTIKKSILKKK